MAQPQCIKLGDFGLSRYMEDQNYYTCQYYARAVLKALTSIVFMLIVSFYIAFDYFLNLNLS